MSALRAIYAFVVGAIAGGLVVLFWEQEISELRRRLPGCAPRLRTVCGAVEQEAGVSEVLRTGQDMVRPALRMGGHELVPFWFLIRAPL